MEKLVWNRHSGCRKGRAEVGRRTWRRFACSRAWKLVADILAVYLFGPVDHAVKRVPGSLLPVPHESDEPASGRVRSRTRKGGDLLSMCCAREKRAETHREPTATNHHALSPCALRREPLHVLDALEHTLQPGALFACGSQSSISETARRVSHAADAQNAGSSRAGAAQRAGRCAGGVATPTGLTCPGACASRA